MQVASSLVTQDVRQVLSIRSDTHAVWRAHVYAVWRDLDRHDERNTACRDTSSSSHPVTTLGPAVASAVRVRPYVPGEFKFAASACRAPAGAADLFYAKH